MWNLVDKDKGGLRRMSESYFLIIFFLSSSSIFRYSDLREILSEKFWQSQDLRGFAPNSNKTSNFRITCQNFLKGLKGCSCVEN